MIPESVENKIHQQKLINDLEALGTFLTLSNPFDISTEEYRNRYSEIMKLNDREFLELFTQAQLKVERQKLIKILVSAFGVNLLITLIGTGEFNPIIAIIGIPLGLSIGNGITRLLPNSKLEQTVELFRRELIELGGPDLGGMRRIVRAGLKEAGKSD